MNPAELPGHASCPTCADAATAVRVLELLDDALAVVDAGDGRRETVSAALVRASVGDTLLVHAGEAIAVVDGAAAEESGVCR